MIRIRAAELAPENIGYPIKLVLQKGVEYHMLTGFKIFEDHVSIYVGALACDVDLDYYITIYDKDV